MIQKNNETSDQIAQRLEDSDGLQTALRRAACIARDTHAKSGQKIVIWRDNKIVWEDPTHPSSIDQPPNREFNQLLTLLRDGLDEASEQAVDAIIEIQSTAIPDYKLIETIGLLVDFIKKHRCTSSQKVLIAVGAAIRKVLLNLPSSDIGIAADLLKSEGSLAVPIEVELEVTKLVVQRVAENPSINASHFPSLADAMLSNAMLYSTAKMVNREFYNATALNSVLACLLMQHSESHSLCNQLLQDSPSWFSRLCSNRLKRIRSELASRKDLLSSRLVTHLDSLPLTSNTIQVDTGDATRE